MKRLLMFVSAAQSAVFSAILFLQLGGAAHADDTYTTLTCSVSCACVGTAASCPVTPGKDCAGLCECNSGTCDNK